MQSETRTCQNCKTEFTIDASDFKFYEKVQVPPPTFCPECRLQRRFAWRNERSLYERMCDKCRKQIISVYSPESGFSVYCYSCWWSDKWDGLSYGIDFDPRKPFVVQVRELLQRVPLMNLFGLWTTVVNSEYANMVREIRDCYLVTETDSSEQCMYGAFITHSRDSVDNFLIDRCELCYENVNCRKCYCTFYSVDCENSDNIYFSRNVVNCSNCFACVNLHNKRYHVFNKQYSREEYGKVVQEYKLTSFKEKERMREEAHNFWARFPQKYIHGRHNANVTGDYIYDSKNVFDSFLVNSAEDSRFCSLIIIGGTKESYDFTHYGPKSELLYEGLQNGDASRVFFSWFVLNDTREVEYSMFCIGCNNIFGSVGLKKRKYCILNKQYRKDEYFSLRKQIIGQMNANPYRDKQGNSYRYGEFFPPELSPFAYNETTAQECFSLTKEQALEKGYQWRDREVHQRATTLKHNQLADHIKDVPGSITNEIIQCHHANFGSETSKDCNEQCTQSFRIVPQELKFYRQMDLPLPRLCPNCRHYQRLKQRNPLKLWHRKCTCQGRSSANGIYQNTIEHFHMQSPCPNEFETSYSPERPEIVYCENCYLSEVA